MADRQAPYGVFNFLVEFNGPNIKAGFSDVSGLNTELVIAEYRAGDDKENHVRKIPGLHKVGDVTLKRGIINSKDFWEWIKEARSKGVAAKCTVTITLLDETSQTHAQRWVLQGVLPLKWTGPTLAAKSSSDVAMEELVLSAESILLET